MRRLVLLLTLGLVVTDADPASGQSAYREPPAPIGDILSTPPVPQLALAPTRDRGALISTERYPPIKRLAEPMARLAGLRIDPNTNGPARESHSTGVTFIDFATLKKTPLIVPVDHKLEGLHDFSWCPDGKHFLIHNDVPTGMQLWVGDATTGLIRLVPALAVNGVFGGADWASPDTIVVMAVPAGRGPAPLGEEVPAGPVVQESKGKPSPVRTYQDLLKSGADEALFAHYATATVTLVDRDSLASTRLGKPDLYTSANLSPDGKYLLTTRLKKPFSYLYAYNSFPKSIEVMTARGEVVATVADLPLQDAVPIEGVPTGPRRVRWLPTEPATLFYAEALDGGDPRQKVEFRDALFLRPAPFAEPGKLAVRTPERFSGISFLEGGAAMVTDYERERKWIRTVQLDLAKPATPALLVFDRSSQDRYGDPGAPLSKTLPGGEQVLRTFDGKLWLSGAGANPKGDKPFLALYDPVTRDGKKVFESRDGYYESATPLNDSGTKLLIRRESPTEPGNYYLRDGDRETALTNIPDPYPELRKVKKQLVTTKRPDGVTISFTLYTPTDYVEGKRYPTVFWAYPREFASADDAGQVAGSPNRFVTLGGYSHLFFLTQGYAVMDEVSIPIVGPPATANNTFVEQIASSALAAINKAVEMGVVDRNRIGVGGHSYGAFMTANLLAHTNYFRAGVARSGAYNRTLTPFGFQNERRTFWEAPQVYAAMSPFNNVTKIDEPLLLIHGQADSNPGTFPVQSERMYQALRGVGGTARLVLLPHEDHGYRANESVRHVLAETVDWFDKYVKNAAPVDAK